MLNKKLNTEIFYTILVITTAVFWGMASCSTLGAAVPTLPPA